MHGGKSPNKTCHPFANAELIDAVPGCCRMKIWNSAPARRLVGSSIFGPDHDEKHDAWAASAPRGLRPLGDAALHSGDLFGRVSLGRLKQVKR
jgi:hypothetical protein